MPLTAGYWIYAVLLAAVAVCWSYVLVQPGMLLAPVQAWVRSAHKWLWKWSFGNGPHLDQCGVEALYYTSHNLDGRWWWQPLWGCYLCVAGQWGFWGYLLLFPLSSYSLLSHLAFAAITILFAAVWRAVYALCQTVQ